MEFKTERIGDHYLVYRPSTGAVSLFSPAEYLVFRCIGEAPDEEIASVIRRVMETYRCDEGQIGQFTRIFMRKLELQGWMRKNREEAEPECLKTVYLTVTTGCNLACSYCYIGDDRRKPENLMSLADASFIMDKIKAFNPDPSIAITGGEPFTHPQIFGILDALEDRSVVFTIGSNAVLIDDQAAKRLKNFRFLHHVQVSIDGMTPEVHAITRGDSWHATMKGIRNLIARRVPFSLAPTLHERNLHEVADIARFAYENGGFYAPNHLRKFPHAPHAGKISLSPGSLRNSIIETSQKVKAGKEADHTSVNPLAVTQELRQHSRCRYVCGNAWYSVDIDWNGDVYPCHLLREKELILGNILNEEFPVIMERGKRSRTRVKAYDIPGCRECAFVATCAGGCRASAYYNQETFAGRDEFCEILYRFEIDKLFYAKYHAGYIPPLVGQDCGTVNRT